MFHFPGCPSHGLLIHPWMTAHYHSRVPPFGHPWIKAYLQLPMAFRSLSRPSSAISALASTLRSSLLDLPALRPLRRPSGLRSCRSFASSRMRRTPKTRCSPCAFDLSSASFRSSLLSGLSPFLPRFPSDARRNLFLPCAVFKVRRALARVRRHSRPAFASAAFAASASASPGPSFGL